MAACQFGALPAMNFLESLRLETQDFMAAKYRTFFDSAHQSIGETDLVENAVLWFG
jgi:hypothetical protein